MKLATITAVRPPARFGELFLKKNKVITFTEKPNKLWLDQWGLFYLSPYNIEIY